MSGPGFVRYSVPATTANLGPGFDCLGLALNLRSEFAMRVAEAPGEPTTAVEVFGEIGQQLATDDRNLVIKSARAVLEKLDCAGRSIALKMRLGAPLARGLGSSATAIVAGVAGANAALGNPLSEGQCLAIMSALEGHPDNVTPCYLGGLTASLAAEDGRVLVERCLPSSELRFVVFVPEYQLSTAKARAAIPKTVPHRDAVFNLSRVPFVLQGLRTGDGETIARALDDRLHQPYRRELVEHYTELTSEAERAGAYATCLSGAGPTLLAVCEAEQAAAVAEAMSTAAAELGTAGSSFVLRADSEGFCLREPDAAL